MKKVVTFGEIMLRLAPPGFLRFSQTNSFDVVYGGGESNVAVSLANYGIPVDFELLTYIYFFIIRPVFSQVSYSLFSIQVRCAFYFQKNQEELENLLKSFK